MDWYTVNCEEDHVQGATLTPPTLLDFEIGTIAPATGAVMGFGATLGTGLGYLFGVKGLTHSL